jgi:hypothetical protein
MRWGLIPHSAKDASVAANTINAKSETAATKPAFRDPLRLRRCLIPADAFYEWKRTGASKQPYCFEVNNGELFALAGLWDGWKDASGKWGEDLFDSHHNSKCGDLSSPRLTMLDRCVAIRSALVSTTWLMMTKDAPRL